MYPTRHNVTIGKFLFDAAATESAEPTDTTFSYANVRVIMFIDEYVKNNVESLSCTATLLKPNTSCNSTMQSHIKVISEQISSTQLPYTCAPAKSLISNSVLVVCSPTLIVVLLGFFQLLQLHPIVSYC